jgi:alkylhydroperoxidase family enzyme
MAPSTTFVAVYRGATIGEAHLLAVSTDRDLVRDVVTRLLGSSDEAITDPAVRALEDGRREALEASMPEAAR